MPIKRISLILTGLIFWQFTFQPLSAADISAEQMKRGSQLYAQYCFMCHQSSGQGIGSTFPPLARSDYLAADKDRSIRILITGLSGAITVHNQLYNGVMPPAPYDDRQLADVLTYVHNSFGNTNGAITEAQVQKIRAQVGKADLVTDPNPFAPLPAAPAGFTLREVTRLPNSVSRMASDDRGKCLYLLCQNADVWRVDLPSGALRQILHGEDYANPSGAPINCMGITLDARQRLYITSNLRLETRPYVTNQVVIYRTANVSPEGDPANPQPWLQVSYPFGVSSFNHGVSEIATGPDGFLYVSSGSRTDGNETGGDTNYYPGGEVPLSSSLWRLDPRAEKPTVEIFARGLRNPYGFCWNDHGEMFATDNGPDRDAPEELNLIEVGKHYGFPYRFSNWTNKVYPYTPEPPPGIQFTPPIANLGPDGGGSITHALYTFDPHSSPGGIIFLGNDFPPGYRGTFLVTRFGNLLACPKDVGFDLLQVRLEKNAQGVYEARVKTVLAPLARPVDLVQAGLGKIYICEYTRVADNSGKTAMLPGRVLELAVKP